MEEIRVIPIENIVPDPQNLRQIFEESEIQALADNLVAIGQTDPIQVFERGDGTYDLFDGERRWRAARLRGLPVLKAIVVPRPNDRDLLVKKISRLMQTKTLTFQEEIRALEEGLQALGIREDESRWNEAAKRLGIPPQVLRERMRVRRLSLKLQDAFEKGDLDYTIAQTLGRIDDTKRQEELAAFIEEAKLSNRFVTTKFIQTALEFPEKPPLEIYDIARQRERFRFAEPRSEEIPASTVDQLDQILADVRRVQGWLETVSREHFLDELHESAFNARRFWSTLHRLNAMTEAFIRVNLWRYTSRHGEAETLLKDLELPQEKLLPSPPGGETT